MKDGLKYLVGKRIAAVVVARSKRPPHDQVFLVFDDGTRFELYGENFTCCSGLDPAAGIAAYVKNGGGEIAQVHAAPETTAALMSRDLKAWDLARAAIVKARRG